MRETKMHLVRDWNRVEGAAEVQGLAGWLLAVARHFRSADKRQARRHMRVVETLPMGPKRNLYLVSCDGERFLVGTGQESVQTIVRVRPESASLGLVRGGDNAQ